MAIGCSGRRDFDADLSKVGIEPRVGRRLCVRGAGGQSGDVVRAKVRPRTRKSSLDAVGDDAHNTRAHSLRDCRRASWA